MPETVKIKLANYTMKLRLYPSAAQKEQLDRILHALHVAYNITFHEVFQRNPLVCTKPNERGEVWPDFQKMANKNWRRQLIQYNPSVDDAPAAALMIRDGLFRQDAKNAWKKGMHSRPVKDEMRKAFRFYNQREPRRSFTVQLSSKRIKPSPDNEKVAWLTLPKVGGRIKARGFDRKLWFGEGGVHTYAQALERHELAEDLTVRVSKDRCGDYFLSITFSEGEDRANQLYREVPAARDPVPIGVDVGVKDIAVLSTGEKVENKHFKRQYKGTLARMGRQLSRRWGPANPGFRDFARAVRRENRGRPEEERLPPVQPSERYRKTQRNRALLERRIARQRDTYYHQQTAAIVGKSSLIAVETLQVKHMLRNHRLAYALADAAMSDFLAKLRYKAERREVPVVPIGQFEPSSQLCSVCGTRYDRAKDLGIRRWTCPKCGARHDRDVNAAKNILAIAQEKGPAEDAPPPPAQQKKPPSGSRKKRRAVLPDAPDLAVIFSRELSGPQNARYVIQNTRTGQIVDDA